MDPIRMMETIEMLNARLEQHLIYGSCNDPLCPCTPEKNAAWIKRKVAENHIDCTQEEP
jgi:hypothetical protein